MDLIDPGGLLEQIYAFGIKSSVFPPLIFLGIGAMTDFTPLLARPQTFILGAAAQFGIFATLLGAGALGFTQTEAASIAIIGGADGPTAIYLTGKLADHLLGAVAVAAYSYMALVPIIQPPIIRLLTTRRERLVRMADLRPVSTWGEDPVPDPHDRGPRLSWCRPPPPADRHADAGQPSSRRPSAWSPSWSACHSALRTR